MHKLTLVLLATLVQLINGNVVQSLAHWPIAQAETIAAIAPILTRVKVRIVKIDLRHQLLVASL